MRKPQDVQVHFDCQIKSCFCVDVFEDVLWDGPNICFRNQLVVVRRFVCLLCEYSQESVCVNDTSDYVSEVVTLCSVHNMDSMYNC